MRPTLEVMSQPPVSTGPGSQAVPPSQQRLPHWPVLRKKQVFVVPIAAIIVGALVMGFFVWQTLMFTQTSIGLAAVALSAAAAIIGILLLTWLDRWEPEPPHLLLSAFFWGGGVALLLTLIGSIPFLVVGADSDFLMVAISAPLVEESAKGLFLVVVLLLTRRGRAEFNSLTDALVYSGFVGIGFAFVEDMLYIAGQDTLGSALTLAGVRVGLGAWSHAIYTAMTGIGLWLFVSSRSPARFLWVIGGWLVAVLLHAIHNGSTFLGLGAYFLSLLIFSLPALLVFIVLAVRSHRNEGRTVQSQLPAMVYYGWVTPEEADWLANLRSRKQVLQHAKTGGPQERTRVRAFKDHVTELAFVRDRLDRMGPPFDRELVAQHDELVSLLEADKQWVAAHLQPIPSQWRHVPGIPGRDYLERDEV